jgi:hypothetical protein
MSFEIFEPAAFAAVAVFVLFNLFFFMVTKRFSDRLWSIGISAFLSVLIYTYIVGVVFEEYAIDYLPEYLFKLFF